MTLLTTFLLITFGGGLDADAIGAPMQNVHILLPPPQISWLTAQAKQRGNISRAAVIRQLIAEEIKKQQPTA
jgi:hypothetical protein